MLKYIYYVILPIVVGALPYVFLRKDASVFVLAVQGIFSSYFGFDFSHRQVLRLDPYWHWITYNLPDALWAFSLTSFVILSTKTDSHSIKLLYSSVSIVIMLGLEITIGTFDWWDLAAMFIGSCTSIATLFPSLQQKDT